MNFRLIIKVLGLLAMVGASGCSYFIFAHYRFKMTVTVQTPSGMRTGSGVIDTSCRQNIAENIPGSLRIKGDAVHVDIDDKRSIIVLISGNAGFGAAGDKNSGSSLSEIVTTALIPEVRKSISFCDAITSLGHADNVGRSAVIPRDHYPTILYFEDVNDPSTVHVFDAETGYPTKKGDLTIRSLSVEVVREPVTSGIGKRLPWLGSDPSESLKPNHKLLDRSLPARLRYSDFTKG